MTRQTPDPNDSHPAPTLAAVILTRNEAGDIAACIQSCAFADDVLVFDSMSTDQTVEIARQHGATVVQRDFTNYAEQRNAAIEQVRDHSWVLMVDADERVPESLAVEIRGRLQGCGATTTMFCMRRKDFLNGTWLKRSSGYPTWFARLFRPNCSRFVRDINEVAETTGATDYLSEHLDHYPFSKGLAFWIERHNGYSTMEAKRLLREQESHLRLRCNVRDPAQRRRVLKQMFYRLPCRPTLAFVMLYIIRGGFLDGHAGLQYCRLRAMYEYMIQLKMAEAKRLGNESQA
jgi:glycosyltransferase involved in cell wall biosynthesis